MDDAARRDAYRRQPGRPALTPRQRRRANHKRNREGHRCGAWFCRLRRRLRGWPS